MCVECLDSHIFFSLFRLQSPSLSVVKYYFQYFLSSYKEVSVSFASDYELRGLHQNDLCALKTKIDLAHGNESRLSKR